MIENIIILAILKCVAVIGYSNKITKFITISKSLYKLLPISK